MAASRDHGSVRGKQLFSCLVKNREELVAFTKTAHLREMQKLFSCPDLRKYVTKWESFFLTPRFWHFKPIFWPIFLLFKRISSFRLLCDRFRVLWPENVGFSTCTACTPHKWTLLSHRNDWIAESQKKLQNYWFRLNVERATRNSFAGQMWPAGHVFVTPGLDRFQPIIKRWLR